VDIGDRLNVSIPLAVMKQLNIRHTEQIAELDKDILKGLKEKGFKTNSGMDGSGLFMLVYEKAGGYYLDTGASKMIIDSKIHLKSGTEISHFVQGGAVMSDGSLLEADLFIFATSFGDVRESISSILGPSVGERIRPVWGLNEECEVRTAWRSTGVERVWVMMGNLAMCRFHSKHLALQIKAMEEGLFKTSDRYEPPSLTTT